MINLVGLFLASILNGVAVKTGNIALGVFSIFFVVHFAQLIGADRGDLL